MCCAIDEVRRLGSGVGKNRKDRHKAKKRGKKTVHLTETGMEEKRHRREKGIEITKGIMHKCGINRGRMQRG